MKYSMTEKAVFLYFLDDNNGKHEWTEIFKDDGLGTRITYKDASGDETFIDCHIPFNENNPQQSIDKIKKLVALK
jgi:hypothetical protein